MHARLLQITSLVWITVSAGIGLAADPEAKPPTDAPAVDFARDVQPIFARNCAKCHGAEEPESDFRISSRESFLQGGDSGEAAVIPGKSGESSLIDRVDGSDEFLRMPPEDELLKKEEVAILKKWIDAGAEIPAAVAGETTLATDHWSFQPLQRPEVPMADPQWGTNSVDAFIVRKLTEKGLRPASRADRATLIRRIYLDVLGLLPSPTRVERFVANDSPQAYEALVEEVLASPHYGERWARHWLDVVRFAESNGFETNYERPTAYFYRDWVIEAFNNDMPYDEFVRAQIAGDSLGQDAATGFLVGGAVDRVKSPDPVLTAMQRQDELADMVNTTGTAFLGLTVGCARCHSHKFDPILQKDYYSLQAVFAGVNHGERALSQANEPQREQRLTELAAKIASLNNQLGELQPAPFTGRTLFIDDEDPRRVRLLAEKRGHGVNPAGRQRGQADDPGGIGRLPNISEGRYTWWDNVSGRDYMAYHPTVSGRFRVWLSWGAGWNTHTPNAQYYLDNDGDPATTDDQQLIATVDQQRFGDGSGDPVSQPLWSGFADAGVHAFHPAASIVVRGGTEGQAITADLIVLQEEADDESVALTAPRLLPPVNAKTNEEHFPVTEARFVRFNITASNSSEPCLDELEIWSAEDNPRNVALATTGSKATSSGDYQGNPKHRLEHINDGQYGNGRSWISNTPGRGWVQIELAQPTKIDRIVWGRDREEVYQDRLAIAYAIEVSLDGDQWQEVASHQMHVPFGLGPAEQLAYRTIGLSAEEAARAGEIAKELESLQAEQASLSTRQQAYIGTFSQPGPTYRLMRGDPMTPAEEVAPEALTVLGKQVGALELAANTPEKDRRLALAQWIADPNNPLTPRVIVNRLWHYHFGRGIVATPSDFGDMGFKPTHPELLDWLASELIENDWSLKHIHRLILNSQTYQQSNTPRPEAIAVDKGSTLLWRFPPRRLEAEAIRDNILLVSGKLDRQYGGPGFMLFQPNSNYSRNWVAKDTFGPEEFRRMVYALKLRMEPDAVFAAFDCPDGGQIAPRRPRSTTPIQALNLFNSAFLVQQSGYFAERVREEAGAEVEPQIDRAFHLIFGRSPTAEELADAKGLVAEHGLESLCRALYNTSEFIFIP